MNPSHRKYLVNELIRGIEVIGPQFEQFGQKVADYLVDETLTHPGLNPQGLPVKDTIDTYSLNANVAVEYSADKNYFERPFKKLIGDFKHVRTNHPQATRIYLMSAQACGPKLKTRLANIGNWIERRYGIKAEIYDSRRIAEFIVDELLLNDEAVETLSPLLAPLERVRTEYAATNLVPAQNESYIEQTEIIHEISRRIRDDRVAVIAGVSGSGKSETAVAVATKLAGDFEMVIWIDATDVDSLTELQGLEVERRGRRVNIYALLKEYSCLVVLDDLRLSLTEDELKRHTDATSAILVTRQTASPGDFRILDLSDVDAMALLQHGIDEPCPQHVLDKVRQTAAGHPLTLRLMNVGVKQSSWEDLYADCDSIGEFPDEERRQRLTDRILGRLRPTLERELSLFLWAKSSRLDRSFGRRAIAPVGLRKLDEYCMVAADRHDVVRLHEAVWSALRSSGIPYYRYESTFEEAIDAHIKHLAFSPGEALNFRNFCDLHKKLIQEMLSANPKRSTCVYCLSHAWSDTEIDPSILPDPAALCADVETGALREDIDVSAFCEIVESLYRRDKLDHGIDKARQLLGSRLKLFDNIADTTGLTPHARRTALHHKAKALRNLRRFDAAIELAESVANEFDSPATDLLLAKLLLYGDADSAEKARLLLVGILRRAKESPEQAEISVVLASIETLGWGLLSKASSNALSNALDEYGDLVADYIVSSAARGFDHAIISFAAIGRTLRYQNEGLFLDVFNALGNAKPEDVADPRERAAWGNIYLAASDAQSIDNADEYAAMALDFFESIDNPDSFLLQQKGHCLVKLARYEDARGILQQLVDASPNPWNRYWLAKTLTEIGEFDEAVALLDDALRDPKRGKFEATLWEQRFETRTRRGDEDAFEDLEKAIKVCKDDKYGNAMANKLAEIKRDQASQDSDKPASQS